VPHGLIAESHAVQQRKWQELFEMSLESLWYLVSFNNGKRLFGSSPILTKLFFGFTDWAFVLRILRERETLEAF
jgi:hypothetical protein